MESNIVWFVGGDFFFPISISIFLCCIYFGLFVRVALRVRNCNSARLPAAVILNPKSISNFDKLLCSLWVHEVILFTMPAMYLEIQSSWYFCSHKTNTVLSLLLIIWNKYLYNWWISLKLRHNHILMFF